jgi:hypothetical protein
MKNLFAFGRQLISVLALLLLGSAQAQRPSSGQRLDVYIAGFFPYANGAENSDTGTCGYTLKIFGESKTYFVDNISMIFRSWSNALSKTGP